jgi:peptidoglycan/LPS O-acetylase OafA/YrhL
MALNCHAIIRHYFYLAHIFHKKEYPYFCEPKKGVMIQRVQSLYLLLVVLLNATVVFWLPLWKTEEGIEVFAMETPWLAGLFALSGVLALFSIFMFKNRKLQFVLGRLNIILNFVLLGFFVYWTLMVPGEMQISEKGIGMFLPVLSIVFLVLANKAIKRDEDLVKSVDRLR